MQRAYSQMQLFQSSCPRAAYGTAALIGLLLSADANATSMGDRASAGIDIIPKLGGADALREDRSVDGDGIRPIPVNASILPKSTQGDLHRLPLALLHDVETALPAGSVTPPIIGAPVLSRFDALMASAAHDLQDEMHKQRFDTLTNAPDFDALDAYYDAHGFTLRRARKAVSTPPLFLKTLPRTLANGRDIPRRKRLFISVMLPHILAANAEIEADRQRLQFIISSVNDPIGPSHEDINWLFSKFTDYRVKDLSTDRLLARMDTIPPALAIAQAAKESGWGGSRFAQAGNALYGQWTWNSAHKGIIPKERPKGKTYRVRAFDSVLDATRGYMLNLNANRAYGGLRERRQQRRKAGKPLTGIALAEELLGYSAIGNRYVKALKSLIRDNKLTALNSAKLGKSFMPHPPKSANAPNPKSALIARN